MTGYVVGVDAGGTSTRALVLDAESREVGRAVEQGANPNSHPPAHAAKRISEAIRAALGSLVAADVRAGVVGMAGASKLSDPAIAALFDEAWRDVGLQCPVRVVTDAEVAFATATAHPDGTVLIAGTGSIAARITDHRLNGLAGGYGWLLGDEGSAYWLGREAVRATLRAVQTGAPLDAFAHAVLAEANVSTVDDRILLSRKLITSANAEAPIRLARFAPLVSEHQGDPLAADIADRAAAALANTVRLTRSPDEHTPVVTAGSVASPDGPVGARLREHLAGEEVLFAADGLAGAAWLAALDGFAGLAKHPGVT
ncbi:N-acetylglucosamine kinase [Herbihabitans rhizosphaerae]|uniref:N-acetylglucosamine kinase n=1 Tax=Herbihabitans rhizosphaerae TaxID=1872711 RepID=UPI00102B73AE|nr:BadF/BadG/BcrA/BcrD ATPase family protein [Herbihabitans rhizosphaerae]